MDNSKTPPPNMQQFKRFKNNKSSLQKKNNNKFTTLLVISQNRYSSISTKNSKGDEALPNNDGSRVDLQNPYLTTMGLVP